MIRLVIFDFDGTLGDTRGNIVKTMQMTIAERQLPPRSDNECAATIGLPLGGCFEALYPQLSQEEVALCAATYRRIFEANLHEMRPQPFPRVRETLGQLRQMGVVLTIASSRHHASLVTLTRDMGIDGHFSYWVGADDVEKAKPHPEPVLKTLAAMNIRPEETLVVGDMVVDILMGAQARTKTCGVTWGNGTRDELEKAGADHIIRQMDELTEIVAADIR